jgi:hypothetical protein
MVLLVLQCRRDASGHALYGVNADAARRRVARKLRMAVRPARHALRAVYLEEVPRAGVPAIEMSEMLTQDLRLSGSSSIARCPGWCFGENANRVTSRGGRDTARDRHSAGATKGFCRPPIVERGSLSGHTAGPCWTAVRDWDVTVRLTTAPARQSNPRVGGNRPGWLIAWPCRTRGAARAGQAGSMSHPVILRDTTGQSRRTLGAPVSRNRRS